MEAEKVTEKIISDANTEAEEIKKQAQEKESAEQAEFDKQLQDYKKQTQTLAQKAGDDKKSHILAAARMEIAKQFLTEKRLILDDSFDRAKQQIKELPGNDYRQIMKKLMLSAVETGDEEVILDTNETRIDEGFIENINKELGPDQHGSLKLSNEKQDIGAGFILSRNKIKNNVSLDILLAHVREQLETELAKNLFEN